MTTILWFRNNLRLSDNPALYYALKSRGPIVPVFIWSPEEEGAWAPGAASRWWLHRSLERLDTELKKRSSRLILRRGPVLETLLALTRETGAAGVVWNRRYEPAMVETGKQVKDAFAKQELEARSFNGALLHEPWEIQTAGGRPYQVFTPYWSACLSAPPPPAPLASPSLIPGPAAWPTSLDLDELELQPALNWSDGFEKIWTPGESGGKRALRAFLSKPLADYGASRDIPDRPGTSRLSPHLHFGEISPRQVWHALHRSPGAPLSGAAPYLRELGWREFAHQLLYHFPHTAREPLRPEFKRFPWRKDAGQLKAWQSGRTGYPIVDAGLRELWATGWMHNRVRMIVASFLVKDLLMDWREGARWFWDTLVDADLANNTLGWQWTAGCGADAAPFFRIFNPVLQGEKFDPEGTYVKRWIPELKSLPAALIHKPWLSPVKTTYPSPLLDHAQARDRALSTYKKLRTSP